MVTQHLQDEAGESGQLVERYGEEPQDRATRTHLEQADRLQMQATAALLNDMNGWRCRDQQRKCMAALQGIHRHLRAVKDDVRPVLLEIAARRPGVDYRTLVEEAASPDWVDLRRSLLGIAVDAVAYMEAIDEVLAREPATAGTGASAAAAGGVHLNECSESSAPAQRSRRRTPGSRTNPWSTSRRQPAVTGSSPRSRRT